MLARENQCMDPWSTNSQLYILQMGSNSHFWILYSFYLKEFNESSVSADCSVDENMAAY